MPDDLVLVTGATGAVGPSVVRACVEAGYPVRTMSLDRPAAGLFPPGVDARVGDIADGRSVEAAVAGAGVVVHLAAFLHQLENVQGLDRRFEQVNVAGTESLVGAATAAGARRVVFLSTIAVYGPTHQRVIDESTPPAPDTPYGRTKLAAEDIVLSAHARGGPVGTVLRSAAVYGSRVKGNYRRLAAAIAGRRFIPVGPGVNRRTLVHDTDLGRAVVLAIEHPAAAGATFNVTDGSVHTLRDIVRAIHQALGRRPPRLHVPLGPVRAAAALCEGTCRVLGVRPPVSRAALEKYTEDVAVDGSLMRAAVGFCPRVTLEAGWRETMTALAHEE